MAHYKVKATYLYEGMVEADSQDEAEKLFVDDLNSHYVCAESLDIEQIEQCEDCEKIFDDCSCDND